MAQLLQHINPLKTALNEMTDADRLTLYSEIKSIEAAYWREVTARGTGDTAILRAQELALMVL